MRTVGAISIKIPDFVPGLGGHARLNLATSPERLTEIVRRLALAWTSSEEVPSRRSRGGTP